MCSDNLEGWLMIWRLVSWFTMPVGGRTNIKYPNIQHVMEYDLSTQQDVSNSKFNSEVKLDNFCSVQQTDGMRLDNMLFQLASHSNQKQNWDKESLCGHTTVANKAIYNTSLHTQILCDQKINHYIDQTQTIRQSRLQVHVLKPWCVHNPSKLRCCSGYYTIL